MRFVIKCRCGQVYYLGDNEDLPDNAIDIAKLLKKNKKVRGLEISTRKGWGRWGSFSCKKCTRVISLEYSIHTKGSKLKFKGNYPKKYVV